MDYTREDLIELIDRVSQIAGTPDDATPDGDAGDEIGARLLLIDACMGLFDRIDAQAAEIKRLAPRPLLPHEASILQIRKKD